MIECIPIYEIVINELAQRAQEGCVVPGYDIENADEKRLAEIYDELLSLEISPDFPYSEPEALCDILNESEGCSYKKSPDRETLYGSFYGAWLGRIIGCIIGKPIERFPYGSGNGKLAGWECIRLWQQGAGDAFPPVDYISANSSAKDAYGFEIGCENSLKENIRFAESDDDIRYLVLGLLVNEKYGNNFTADEIADIWQHYLTPSMVFTAEHVAFINSLTCTETDREKKIEFCHSYRNPYREWIGAQIRIDHYGYYNAGDPLAAAKAAYNDANLSHVKNGVYGAMFFAALIAAAFTEKDIKKCIEIALTVIPKKSRLYADIVFAVSSAEKAENAAEFYKMLWERLGDLSPVHTNNNAAACVGALIMGKGDFIRSVSIAIGAGWDTDCNGATVGSVIGASGGDACIPEYLKAPLNDTLYSSIPDFHPASIAECAKRTYKLFMSK